MKKNIIVVDNHPVILKYMTDLLEEQGHRIKTAKDGLSALKILDTWIPDVMFIDMVMPNICGDKLCRIIRSMPELNHVYIIILSAIAAEAEINFTEIGADACIAKGPFDKMSKYVVDVLSSMDQGSKKSLSGKIKGIDDLFQREITKELLSSKKHYEVIMNNMSEGIIEINSEAKIIFVNTKSYSSRSLLNLTK